MNNTCDNIGYYDFSCVIENQSYSEEFTFEDENGVPMDLSAYDIRMDIYPGQLKQGKPVTKLSLGDGLSVIGEANNVLVVDFPKDLTLKFGPVQFYDLLLDLEGTNMYVFEGKIIKKNTRTR